MTNNMESYNPKNPEAFKAQDELEQDHLPEPAPEPLNIQPVADGSVVAEGSLSSPNYRAGQVGWRLSSDGNFEAVNGTFSGTITADDGSIGGFIIGDDTIVGGDLTLSSTGYIQMTQLIGTTKISSNGYEFLVNTTTNAHIILSSGASPVSSGVQLRIVAGGSSGGSGASIELTYTASNTGNLSPTSGKTIDLGTSSSYFNEINYKTLTDRGCLGWFDDGVEMQDGRILSDIEALKAIGKSEEMSVHGVPMLDYATMPKVMYKPAPIAEEDIFEDEVEEDEDGNKIMVKKLKFKKGEKMGHDGAETTSLISIMFGAIKELAGRVETLEDEIEKLKDKQ